MAGLADSVNNLRLLGRAGRADVADVVVERLVDFCCGIIRRDAGVEGHAELIYMLADLLKLKSEFVLFGHAASLEKSYREGIRAIDEADLYARPIIEVLQEVNEGPSALKRANVRSPAASAARSGEEEVSDALLQALAGIVERIAARKPMHIRSEGPTYLSLQQVMREIRILVQERGSMLFEDIFDASDTRERVVLSFLAILILTKMGILHIAQEDKFACISVEYVGRADG